MPKQQQVELIYDLFVGKDASTEEAGLQTSSKLAIDYLDKRLPNENK